MKKQVNFTNIIEDKESLAIILPTQVDLILQIITSTSKWRKQFKQITYYPDSFSYSFFSTIIREENISFANLDKTDSILEKSIILDLRNSTKTKQIFSKSKNCVVIGAKDWANLKLLPAESSPIKKISQLSAFLGISLTEEMLQLNTNKLIGAEIDKILDDASRPLFTFHINSFYKRFMFNTKILKYISGSLKGSIITTKGLFPFNEQSSQIRINNPDLYNLVFLEGRSEFIFTDDLNIHNLLIQLKRKPIFIGSGKVRKEGSLSLKPGNFTEFRKIIST